MTALLPTLTAARESLLTGRRDPSTAQALGELIEQITKRAEAFRPLSERELHILLLVSEGETNIQIAYKMDLADGTVRNYVSGILAKLKLANRAEAAAFAITNNLADYMRNRT